MSLNRKLAIVVCNMFCKSIEPTSYHIEFKGNPFESFPMNNKIRNNWPTQRSFSESQNHYLKQQLISNSQKSHYRY